MKTIRDAHALVLRGLGWTEYVAGPVDAGQVIGWMPPGRGGEDTTDLAAGATLPEGAWSEDDALALVALDSWGVIPGVHFDARPATLDATDAHVEAAALFGMDPVEPTRSVMRITLAKPEVRFQVWQDVDWDVSPVHFPGVWERLRDMVLRALQERLPAEKVEQQRAILEARYAPASSGQPIEGTGWATVATERGTPEPLADDPGRVSGHSPIAEQTKHDLGTMVAWLTTLQLAYAAAQAILDEGGKGSRQRALEVLGFRS